MAVLKNVENKIKLVMIVSCLFLVGCVVISLGSVIIAKTMVDDAHKKIYVLDGNVPILVKQTDMSETFDVEAKSDIEMFHHLFFTLAPDDKYIQYTMQKAMYLIDETGLAQYNALKEKGFYNNVNKREFIGARNTSAVLGDGHAKSKAEAAKDVTVSVKKISDNVYDMTVKGEPGEYCLTWNEKEAASWTVFDFTIK